MTYEKWIENHKIKHQKIIEKLSHLSNEEIIKYFDFDNMVEKEKAFCPLYETNQKCHEMEQLNCYFCACPLFRLGNTKSFCKINSRFGGQIIAPDGFIHQNCTKCKIPHKISYISANFDRDWANAMKDVISY